MAVQLRVKSQAKQTMRHFADCGRDITSLPQSYTGDELLTRRSRSIPGCHIGIETICSLLWSLFAFQDGDHVVVQRGIGIHIPGGRRKEFFPNEADVNALSQTIE